MQASSHSWKRVTENATVVAAGSLVSRIAGLMRDVLIASLLGAGPLADALIVAFRLPNFVRKLFAEGSLSASITATFTHVREQEGSDRVASLMRTCLLWAILILLSVVVIAELGSSFLTATLAPGMLNYPDTFTHAVKLMQMTLPYLACIGLVAFLGGVLHSDNHFFAPAMAPVLLNSLLISGIGIAWLFSLPIAETMCVSLVIGGILQAVLQAVFLCRRSIFTGDWKLRDIYATEIGKKLVPSILSGAVFQLSVLLVTVLASFQSEGTIARLYFADRLVQFPLGIIGVAIGVASLPALSACAATGKREKFGEIISISTRFTLFLSLPAAAGLIALAGPVLQLFFQRGAFSASDVSVAATMLQAFAAGLPAVAVARPLLNGFYATQRTRIPLLAGGCNLVITAASGVLFMAFWGGAGLAGAVALGGWVNALILYAALRKSNPYCTAGGWWVAAYLVLSILVGVGAWQVLQFGLMSLLCIPVFAVGYVAVCYFLRSPDAVFFIQAVLKRDNRTFYDN